MGFRPAIEAILRYMPHSRDRQTLLFSATMPGDVRKIAQLALKERYEFVDCVGEEESTHQHVPQQYTVCGQDQQVHARYGSLSRQPSLRVVLLVNMLFYEVN